MGEVVQLIDKVEERFNSVAPNYIKFDAERGFAIQLLTNNDYLMRAAQGSPDSLLQAITNVAAIGLSLNPAEKLAYLIPRNVKVNGQFKTRVYLEPSYMGLCKLATDSGSIEWVQAVPVYANDKFTMKSVGERPEHEYDAFATPEERGAFKGCYAIAKTRSGDFLCTVMTDQEIKDIRDRSESWKAFMAKKTKSGGPWQTDFIEQAKKTVVRRAFKMWPRTDDKKLAQAIQLSNDNEGFAPLISNPGIGQYTAEQKQFLDQCLEQGDHWGLFKFKESLVDGDASSHGASIWISLTHSFEKGTKGKYGSLINELLAKGRNQLESTKDAITQAVKSGDDSALEEIVIESDDEELLLYMKGMDSETVLMLDEIKKRFGDK